MKHPKRANAKPPSGTLPLHAESGMSIYLLAMKLGGCACFCGLLRVFPEMFWDSSALNHLTVMLFTVTMTHSAVSPSSFCHVNVNVNHQDLRNGVKMAGFPAQQ